MEKSQFFKDLFRGFIWPQVAQKYRLSSVRLNIWPTVNTYAGLYVMIMLRVGFRVNPDSIVYLNVKELLARSRRHASSLCDRNGIRTLNHLLYSVFFFSEHSLPLRTNIDAEHPRRWWEEETWMVESTYTGKVYTVAIYMQIARSLAQ